MIATLRTFLRVQQFNPGWGAPFFNPFFLARRALYRGIRAHGAALSGPLLDVGCGTQPYRSLFHVDRYVGLEIDTPQSRARAVADAFYNGKAFPFGNEQFQTVLCNQVLEHVFEPDRFVTEIRRVLSVGGKLLLTVPFVWDEHEQPFDFARYSSFGLRALLERNGFKILEHHKLLADASVIFQLINAYIYKVLAPHTRFGRLAATVLLMAPVSYLGWFLGWALPRNPDLFLDQLVLAERVQ